MSAPRLLAPALVVVRAASRLAPAAERAALRGEWLAELQYRAHFLQKQGQWTPAAAGSLLLRSFGAAVDALDLRFCGPRGAADPWVEGARIGASAARLVGAVACAALAVAASALACGAASLLAEGASPAWGRIEGGARAFILAAGALWSVAVVAAAARAAVHLVPRGGGRVLAASGVLGVCMAVARASHTPGLPARTAVAGLAAWAALVLAHAALRRRRAGWLLCRILPVGRASSLPHCEVIP